MAGLFDNEAQPDMDSLCGHCDLYRNSVCAKGVYAEAERQGYCDESQLDGYCLDLATPVELVFKGEKYKRLDPLEMKRLAKGIDFFKP